MSGTVVVAGVLALLAPIHVAVAAEIDQKPRKVKDQYIVVLDVGSAEVDRTVDDLVKKHGGKVKSRWNQALRGFSVEMPEVAARALERDSRVLSIEEDQEALPPGCGKTCTPYQYPSHFCADGSIPPQMDRMDALGEEGPTMDGAYYSHGRTGRDEPIYIIDTGIEQMHGEFTYFGEHWQVISRVSNGVSFVSGSATSDPTGHGTGVASCAAGKKGGPAYQARLIPVRIGDSQGLGTASRLIDAFNWIAGQWPGGVVNASWGFNYSTAINNAASSVADRGFVVVVAAGNSSSDACTVSPASARGVVTVGAARTDNQLTYYTNRGRCVSIFATGDVGTAGLNSSVNCNPGFAGTSYAAPQVAGVAALIYGTYNPIGWTAEEVKRVLTGVPDTLYLQSGDLLSGTPRKQLFSKAGAELYACEPEPPCQGY